jgi:hypothetical protein
MGHIFWKCQNYFFGNFFYHENLSRHSNFGYPCQKIMSYKVIITQNLNSKPLKIKWKWQIITTIHMNFCWWTENLCWWWWWWWWWWIVKWVEEIDTFWSFGDGFVSNRTVIRDEGEWWWVWYFCDQLSHKGLWLWLHSLWWLPFELLFVEIISQLSLINSCCSWNRSLSVESARQN